MRNTVHNIGNHLSKIGNFMPFLFVCVLYFFVIRPQQKKEKKRNEMIAALKKGDAVLTSSGIKGIVEKVEGDDVLIIIAQDVGKDMHMTVTFARSAIAGILKNDNMPHRRDPSDAVRQPGTHYRKKRTLKKKSAPSTSHSSSKNTVSSDRS